MNQNRKDHAMAGYPFLEPNIDVLKQIGHPIHQWLSTQQFDQSRLEERIFDNKFGLVDWKMDNGNGMFEAMPPFSFYEQWKPEPEKARTSASVIIGCNVGYGLNHLLMNTPDSHKIIVVEPRPEMLMACLGQSDYKAFIENKKLHFCPPNEDYLYQVIKNLDLQYIYGRIHMRLDIPSQQLGPEYAVWARKTKHLLENFSVELATLRLRQDIMVGNELQNFQQAMDNGSLMPMKERGTGVAAVILGAGPSLSDHAEALRKTPGHALYTTALQTMPVLQNLGIKPHFCLSIDYDSSMLRTYDRLDPEFAHDVPLIYSTKCNPDLVKRYPGPTLPLWTMGGMGTFVMQKHELVLDAGGNVSLSLSRLLRWMGVSHIVLAGQDFAWPKDRSHAKGHHAGERKIKFDPKRHQKIKNAHGEEIISTVQYLTSKREMEADIKKAELPVFNLYGGGAIIEGTHMVDMKQCVTKGLLASVPGSVESFMQELNSCCHPRQRLNLVPRSHKWSVSFRNVEKRLSRLFRKVGKNQEEIHKTMGEVEKFIKQDPLYIPYLFNETLDMAGLTRAKQRYEPQDLGEYKRIIKKVLKKVREVDRCVCGENKEQAA
ncbi:motility associated factor glycosyltransferase family protein [Pseudodesulfovibrio senegalensis]|nr:6-hydroxymethylpterin diphosphokinase MptE-like protein [Pseudodesulfovibrio senegalensis]